MCSSTSKAVTRPQVPERIGSSLASARMTRMPRERATPAAASEYSSAAACQPCSFRTRVLPPPAAPMSSARPGPGSRRSSRRSMARRSRYHQWWSSSEVSSWSSAVSTTSLLQHVLRTFAACTDLPHVARQRSPRAGLVPGGRRDNPGRVVPPEGGTVKDHDYDSAGDTRQDGRLVTVVRRLYERFRQLVHEAAKFGTVGAVAFLTATIGTNLLHFRAGMG